MLQLKHDDVCRKTARTTTRLVDGDPAETFGEGARSIDALLHPKLAAEFGRIKTLHS